MFGKKKRTEAKIGTAFESLLFYSMDPSRNIDEQAFELADCITAHRAVICNFEKIESIDDVNRVVAFLSGVVYATDGETHRLGKETFLFGSEVAFEDGTLHQYTKEVTKFN